MRTAGLAAIDVLLPSVVSGPIDAGDYGQVRHPLLEGSLQRQPPDGRSPGSRRIPDQSYQSAKLYAPHAFTGDFPDAPYLGSKRSIRPVPLPV